MNLSLAQVKPLDSVGGWVLEANGAERVAGGDHDRILSGSSIASGNNGLLIVTNVTSSLGIKLFLSSASLLLLIDRYRQDLAERAGRNGGLHSAHGSLLTSTAGSRKNENDNKNENEQEHVKQDQNRNRNRNEADTSFLKSELWWNFADVAAIDF